MCGCDCLAFLQGGSFQVSPPLCWPLTCSLMNSPAAHRRIKIGVDIRPSPNRCVGQVKCSTSVCSSHSRSLCRPVHVSGTSKSLRDCARVCLCPLLHPGNTTNSANLFYPLLVNEPVKIVPVCVSIFVFIPTINSHE